MSWREDRKKACPNQAKHTPMPEGYLAWHARAEELWKTHYQKRCPSCLLWEIWVPRKRKEKNG